MMRRIVAVTLILVAVATSIYSQPTDDELAGWWESLSRTERLAELRKLDAVEHATPELDSPTLILLQLSDGMIHGYFTDPLRVRIAHLEYEITLPRAAIAGKPATRVGPWFFAGVAAGALAVTLAVVALR